jgi:hypothetical protein
VFEWVNYKILLANYIFLAFKVQVQIASDLKQQFRSVFRESQRKCYNTLQHPFHCNGRNVLNHMVATYKVSFSVMNMNCHGHGMYLSVIITFLHCVLKHYSVSKTVRYFWLILYI